MKIVEHTTSRAVAVLASLFLAACGGSTATPEPASAPAAESEPGGTDVEEAAPVESVPQTSDSSPEAGEARPDTVAEIALYDGADRQEVLEECAKKEGEVSVYTASIDATTTPMAAAFEELYPDVEANVFRAGSNDVRERVMQEYAAGHHGADVIEINPPHLDGMIEEGMLQPYYSPETASMDAQALEPDGHYAAVRLSYNAVGYNTNLLSEDEVPTSVEELLDPKWKGRMVIPASSTGSTWVGAVDEVFGRDTVLSLSEQDITVMNASGRAIADMVIAGEYPLSPTIYNSHVFDSQQQGAPIEWVAIEPLVVNLGSTSIPVNAPHPCAAMLYIDLTLSPEGQAIYAAAGYGSARSDVDDIDMDIRGIEPYYIEAEVEDFGAKDQEWVQLLERYFQN